MAEKKTNYGETLIGFLSLVGIIIFSIIGINEFIETYNRIERIKFETSSPLDSGNYISEDGKYLIKMENNCLLICRPNTKEVVRSFQLSGYNIAFTPHKYYDAFISEENRWVFVRFYPLLGGKNAYKGYNCFIDDKDNSQVFKLLKD